jgi:hypothetical protein
VYSNVFSFSTGVQVKRKPYPKRTSIPVWASTRQILTRVESARKVGSTVKLIDNLAKEEAERLGIRP